MFSNIGSLTNFLITSIFIPPLHEGVGLKNLNSNCFQNFCFWYLGKVKKFHFTTFTRLEAPGDQKNWGAKRPPPNKIGLRNGPQTPLSLSLPIRIEKGQIKSSF